MRSARSARDNLVVHRVLGVGQVKDDGTVRALLNAQISTVLNKRRNEFLALTAPPLVLVKMWSKSIVRLKLKEPSGRISIQ